MVLINKLIARYPCLTECRDVIGNALTAIIHCYESGGKVLVCGNGGSSADADHIVGELMKGFRKNRPLSEELKRKIISTGGSVGEKMAQSLQAPLRAINLSAHIALNTAYSNDISAEFAFAQQVLGYGDDRDVLIGLSTSGNADNVIAAGVAAKAIGMSTIGLCGKTRCNMDGLFDYVVHAPETETHLVQELHQPIYHALCADVEAHFFSE